jgi:hypothetical protein
MGIGWWNRNRGEDVFQSVPNDLCKLEEESLNGRWKKSAASKNREAQTQEETPRKSP